MESAVFLLFSVTAGYLFACRWKLTRAHYLRSEGHALYFLSVFSSVPIFLASNIIVAKAPEHWPSLEPLIESFRGVTRLLVTPGTKQASVVQLGVSSFLSLILAVVASTYLNFPLVRDDELARHLFERRGSYDELERQLGAAARLQLPAMLTLDDGKVYIGYVTPPVPGHTKRWIRVTPLESGYRNERREYLPTTFYTWTESMAAYKRSRGDFDVVVPTDHITSLHLYDPDLSLQFFEQEEKTDVAEAMRDPNEHEEKLHQETNKDSAALYWTFFAISCITPFLLLLPATAPFAIFAGISCLLGFAMRRLASHEQ